MLEYHALPFARAAHAPLAHLMTREWLVRGYIATPDSEIFCLVQALTPLPSLR